jgi:hypothetical protein
MIETGTQPNAVRAHERPVPTRPIRAPGVRFLRETLLRLMGFYWDAPVEFARLLRRLGMKGAAAALLGIAYDANAWDAALGEILCDALFDLGQAQHPPGTDERAAFIMEVMARSYPSERITEAYFENLESRLRTRERRSEPGMLVLGLGPGRVGSTTLAGIIRSNDDAIATHEVPPRVWWYPQRRQIEFHKRRFRMLLQYSPLVFDGAHWWLNLLEEFSREFPSMKVIGLYRDQEAIVRSLASFPARRECGHAAPHNGLWNSTRWSATNPGYDVPAGARDNPDEAKVAIIRRYVAEYNERVRAMAAREPRRFLLLRTEELDDLAARQKIEAFVGLPVTKAPIRLNVGSADDPLSGSVWASPKPDPEPRASPEPAFRSDSVRKPDQSRTARKRRLPPRLRARAALLRLMGFYWDVPAQFARLLWRFGAKRAAVHVLTLAFEANPWDGALGAILCDMSFDREERRHTFGTVERAVFIMRVLDKSYPSERVTEAYFENLEAMLRTRARRSESGLLVLGLGAGRVGTTSLTAIVRSNKDAIVTHENPPFLWWQPHPRQIEFHKRRFRLLLQYAPLVFDSAYWWLNSLEEMFAEFPTSRAIGLVRDLEATVRSFTSLPARHICGHAMAHNGVWHATRWNATRPGYALPEGARDQPDEAKVELIRRYVVEYNDGMRAFRARLPDRFMLLATEQLDAPATREEIGRFIASPVTAATVRVNVGDADDAIFRFSEWL